MFSINFKLMVQRLIPYFLFKEVLRDYLFSAIKGIETTHSAFTDFRIQSIRDIKFTGQTIYLEQLLTKSSTRGALEFTLLQLM